MKLSLLLLLLHAQQRFAKERTGSTVMEFALLAPVFFLITFGIIELGLVLFASTILENAVSDASRFGKTGAIPLGVSREERIREIINNNSNMLLDSNKLTINTLVYDSFGAVGQPEPFTDDNLNGMWDEGESYSDINGNGQWDPDMGAAGAGGPGDVVIYEVIYPWAMMTPILGNIMGEYGIISLQSNLAVRNEPFDSLQIGGGGP